MPKPQPYHIHECSTPECQHFYACTERDCQIAWTRPQCEDDELFDDIQRMNNEELTTNHNTGAAQ